MNKRILSLFLAIALICALLPATLLPASAVVYSGTCGGEGDGSNLIWTLDTETGVLEIKGTGTMLDSNVPWSEYRSEIKIVIIGDSVKSIGNSAFGGCTALTSVTISGSVTSIGYQAFSGCTVLTSITIPDSVTTIGNYAFFACTALTSITITDSVTSIGNGAFSETGYFNEPSNWVDDVLYIGHHLIKARKSLSGGYAITEGTKTIANRAFLNCVELTGISIANSVTNIGVEAFAGCSGLTSILFGKNEKRVGIGAFSGCTGLTTVMIPDNVTSIGGGMFSHCTALKSITVDQGNPNYSSSADGILYNKDQTELICYPAGKTGAYTIQSIVTSIGDMSFAGCTGLTGVTIPGCVTNIGYGAFASSGLTSITIPDSVTGIGDQAFSNCVELTKIELPDHGLTIGNHAFSGTAYYNDTTNWLVSSNWVGELYIGNHLIIVTEGAGSFTVRPGTKTIAKEAFPFGNTLTSITIPKSVVSICDSVFLISISLTDVYYGGTDADWKAISIGKNNEYLTAANIHFEGGTVTQSTNFNDVKEAAWYYDAVNYAVTNGLMNGVGNGNFAPESPMTRAMLVTVLWRYEGEPQEGTNNFSDVPAGQWYTKAVAWAAANGIVGGVGNNKFDPNGNITREQMAAILYRYAEKKGFDTSKRGDLSVFPDAAKVSDWAKDAIAWAVAEGIIGGSDGKLLPQGNATRAQVSTILMRFIEKSA